MKRFALKLLLLLVPVCVFFLVTNALYERTNYWKSKDYANKYTDAPYGIELGNVGSSIPCYALKYDVAPEIKAWNFANLGETSFWNLRVLKNYINHFQEGAVILIEVTYYGVNARAEGFRERYYRILPKEYMEKWSFFEWLAYKKIPILSSGRFKSKIFRDISKEEMSPFYDRNEFMNDNELSNFAVKALKKSMVFSPGAYEKNIEEVSAMIDLCYARKMIPIVVSYPQPDVLNNLCENIEGVFDDFDRFINDLKNKYPNLVCLDYSRDNRFAAHHEYFKDAVHMNNIGAEKFTLTLIEDLRSRGLLSK